MAKLSIEVTGKIRSGLFLLSALWEQGPTVARLVADRLHASQQGGDQPHPFLAQLQALGQILKTALDLLVELDGLSVDENNSRANLFEDRENKIADLGRRISGVRRIITGYYVDPDTVSLGLEGGNARESIALLRQSERICTQLGGDDLDQLLGESLFEPVLDPRPFVPQIEPYIGELRGAFEAHQRSRRRVDELLAKKKKAVEEYDTTFVRVARQFEDLCRLAGFDDLAEKVRPSLTRRGETAVTPPDGEIPESAEGVTDAEADSGPPVSESASETGDEPAAEPASAS